MPLSLNRVIRSSGKLNRTVSIQFKNWRCHCGSLKLRSFQSLTSVTFQFQATNKFYHSELNSCHFAVLSSQCFMSVLVFACFVVFTDCILMSLWDIFINFNYSISDSSSVTCRLLKDSADYSNLKLCIGVKTFYFYSFMFANCHLFEFRQFKVGLLSLWQFEIWQLSLSQF